MADLNSASKPKPITRYTAMALKAITDIKPSEVRLTLALFATVFFLLMAYYIAKPVRDGWLSVSVISGLTPIEVKAFSGFMQSITLITLIPYYTKLYDKLPRGKLLVYVNIFFMACFPVFWLIRPGLLGAISPYCGVAFYIWIGIFGVAVVAQFWSFAADIYDEASGKRLFPLIALGATSGALLGSLVTKNLIERLDISTYTLLLIAPLVLAISTYILWRIDKSEQASKKRTQSESAVSKLDNLENPARDDTTENEMEGGHKDLRSAWQIILGTRYITLIALFIFMLNWVATNGENILYAAIQDSIAKMDFSNLTALEIEKTVSQATSAFYSRINFWVSLVGTFLQAFIVSRLLKYGGLKAIMMLPPIVSLASNGAIGSGGGTNVITTAYTAENSTNYSVANTATQVVWLPVSKCALYKAKAAIDTTVFRSADAIAALTVLIGSRLIDIQFRGFIILNLCLIAIWILIALLILKERRAWDGVSPIGTAPMNEKALDDERATQTVQSMS